MTRLSFEKQYADLYAILQSIDDIRLNSDCCVEVKESGAYTSSRNFSPKDPQKPHGDQRFNNENNQTVNPEIYVSLRREPYMEVHSRFWNATSHTLATLLPPARPSLIGFGGGLLIQATSETVFATHSHSSSIYTWGASNPNDHLVHTNVPPYTSPLGITNSCQSVGHVCANICAYLHAIEQGRTIRSGVTKEIAQKLQHALTKAGLNADPLPSFISKQDTKLILAPN